MLTIVETEDFERLWSHYWTEQEYNEFITYMIQNPDIGDVVKGSGGMRKCAGVVQVLENPVVYASFILIVWLMVKSG